jgi:hypothetical protein
MKKLLVLVACFGLFLGCDSKTTKTVKTPAKTDAAKTDAAKTPDADAAKTPDKTKTE